jgi:hypothetical protein
MSANSITNMSATDFSAKKPMTSKVDPSTANSYLEGGPFFFGLHGDALSGPQGRAAVDPNATLQERAEALRSLPVVLSETHITGGKYSRPSDDVQNLLFKIPEEAVEPIQNLEEWAVNTVFENQGAWGLKKENLSVVQSRFEPLLKTRDGYEGYAISAKLFTKKCEIYVQDPDNPSVFDKNGTHYDIKKGAKCAVVIELRGLRLKAKEFAIQTPVVSKIYVFANTSAVAPPVSFGGFDVSFTEPVGSMNFTSEEESVPAESDSVADSVYQSVINDGADAPMDMDVLGSTVVCK